MRFLLAGFVFLLAMDQVLFAQGEAAPLDGNELLKRCSRALNMLVASNPSSDELRDAMYCIGYVDGFIDGVGLVQAVQASEGGRRFFCLPQASMETGQFVRLLVKWLEDHPAELHRPVRGLFLSAMENAFPCRE